MYLVDRKEPLPIKEVPRYQQVPEYERTISNIPNINKAHISPIQPNNLQNYPINISIIKKITLQH
ncbi:hypothetical protein PGTUg99_024534 [Puccinia graminis f. sp. tritici]|uniref:Uncharacterized protein n=1 Tax=Puccinia graminis f. sp. tritici TaxID=56615 RepID=A0A5B0PIY5_PUCGR|nr:hypothetical protein PGTUg99_024534 [Puccinia graminis f. sp. tritici]